MDDHAILRQHTLDVRDRGVVIPVENGRLAARKRAIVIVLDVDPDAPSADTIAPKAIHLPVSRNVLGVRRLHPLCQPIQHPQRPQPLPVIRVATRCPAHRRPAALVFDVPIGDGQAEVLKLPEQPCARDARLHVYGLAMPQERDYVGEEIRVALDEQRLVLCALAAAPGLVDELRQKRVGVAQKRTAANLQQLASNVKPDDAL
mmetsp:Transcript_27236/g.67938  ORF Transcript_27236/g.67938 Transcript_27236/m.67938 type:complete len:203 (-) Transcript_27236:49-657(-)